MKNSKLFYISILVILFAISSCENEGVLVIPKETTKSISARISMSELRNHFNDNGSLNSDGQENSVGNILFDYCFDFEYPVTLSYNNGAIVVINDIYELIGVLTNISNTLFVDGISFPFNVFVFDQTSNAVVIQTINNELEFGVLINSCGFNNETCQYTDEIAPVCVEIQDVLGGSYTMEFPNMSYAVCSGFTEDDLVACESNADNCFDFVYPISILSYNETIIPIHSDDEWNIVMFNLMGDFTFIYPLNVELHSDDSIQTITNLDGLTALLTDCSDSCEITGLTTTIGNCNSDGTYNLTIDFDLENPTNQEFEILFHVTNENSGTYNISDLPITFNNMNADEDIEFMVIRFSNLCSIATDWNCPDCPVNCEITGLTTTIGDCNPDGTYNVTIDFDVENLISQEFNLYFEMTSQYSGAYNISDLPITFSNMDINEGDNEWVYIRFSEECNISSNWLYPDCN